MEKKFRYSEIFGGNGLPSVSDRVMGSFQGEGRYSGHPTVWLRTFGCNFECRSFGQSHLPIGEQIDPYASIDPKEYKTMEELPVLTVGCDSGYSWAKKFAHLAKQGTPKEITNEIRSRLEGGSFQHPKSKQYTHMAFTGGEPILNQTALVEVMSQFLIENDAPRNITIETNGTQKLRQPFIDVFSHWMNIDSNNELFWSVSPKLYLSGESWSDAIRPDIVETYDKLSNRGQLKYVCDGSERAWDEVERATDLYRSVGIDWSVWIMPVSATKEGQEDIQAKIADQTMSRGYNFAARIHCWVYGNDMGR